MEFRKVCGQHPVIVFEGRPTRLRQITLILVISVFARLRDRLRNQRTNGTSFNTILETILCHYELNKRRQVSFKPTLSGLDFIMEPFN